MIGDLLEALAFVEPVRVKPDQAGIQMDLVAALSARLQSQPVQQGLAHALGAPPAVCDQIVDRQEPAAVQHLHDAKPRHAGDLAIDDRRSQRVTASM